jgi:lipoprotein NlpI
MAARQWFLSPRRPRQGAGRIQRGDPPLTADNAQFYNDRAHLYSDRNDYARAIADYDAAVRLNSGYSASFNGRGLAYYFSGDDEHALQDFNEAIQLRSNYGQAINNRGNLYIRDGNLDKALDDYVEAVRLLPQSHIPLANRGQARLYQASYKLAVDDLAAALVMKPGDPYLALWLYLARARDGQDGRAALAVDAAQFNRSGWPWPLIAVYLGQSDAKTVLADLRRDANPDRNSQECEAGFYLGAKAAIDGQPAVARELLQLARANCRPEFIEGDAARYELARLP